MRGFAKILPLFILSVFLVTSGFGCKGGSKAAKNAYKKVNLQYWRVFDDEFVFEDLINKYKLRHPNISVTYKKFRYNEYQDELLNALAEDRGPDIFTVGNTWMGEYLPKLDMSPPSTTLARKTVKGKIKKEEIIEMVKSTGITPAYVKKNFVDQAAYDVIWKERKTGKERVFGVPLAMDTLVLFYNKDLLNDVGIPNPPKDWNEFQAMVKKIVRLDAQNNILIAGAALGAAGNVARGSDILSVLMMQNGTIMQQNRSVQFAVMPKALEGQRVTPPGWEALQYYLDFSSPVKEVYTWNDSMPNSLDAFVSGRLAFFFGYSYHIPIINARAPKLSYAITKIPQIPDNKEVNFANYFVEAVSKKSAHKQEAWNFLKFISSPQNVKSYLDKAQKPTAVRDLVLVQREDAVMAPFVSSVLNAKSWYKGYDPLAAEKIMDELVKEASQAQKPLKKIISAAAERVQQTVTSRKSSTY